MPMYTELHRDNEIVSLRWGMFHVTSLYNAMVKEGVTKEDFFMGFPRSGRYEFKEDHTYTDESDDEIFQIKAGDVYEAFR